MEEALQHETTTQRIGLSPASPGNHPSDGPKTGDALTFKMDHSSGADHDQNAERFGAAEPYADALMHFRQRYVSDGGTNHKFQSLHFRKNDRRELVEAVLLGNDVPPTEMVKALLIIAFRLRNNLFHGLDPPPVKWSAVMIRKRRIENGQQATEAGRDCLEVAAG